MPLLRLLGLPVYLPSALMAVGQMALLVVLPLYVLDLGVATLTLAMSGWTSRRGIPSFPSRTSVETGVCGNWNVPLRYWSIQRGRVTANGGVKR